MNPEEEVKEIVEFIYNGDSHYDESIKKIKDMLSSAFSDGIIEASGENDALDHSDCPDFEDWWKGNI